MTSRPARVSPPSRWLVVPALAVGGLLRLSLILYHDISADDATVGLMARHFLIGETFPAFFYRLPYLGSVHATPLVPMLFVFGPSIIALRLAAVACSLLVPLGLYLLGRRVFDEPTGRAALLLGALAPLLPAFFGTLLDPHGATPIAAVFLLLLTVAGLLSRRRRLATLSSSTACRLRRASTRPSNGRGPAGPC